MTAFKVLVIKGEQRDFLSFLFRSRTAAHAYMYEYVKYFDVDSYELVAVSAVQENGILCEK
jgi:hypothetical protein